MLHRFQADPMQSNGTCGSQLRGGKTEWYREVARMYVELSSISAGDPIGLPCYPRHNSSCTVMHRWNRRVVAFGFVRLLRSDEAKPCAGEEVKMRPLLRVPPAYRSDAALAASTTTLHRASWPSNHEGKPSSKGMLSHLQLMHRRNDNPHMKRIA